MGYWSIVVPETTTNRCDNPSFETNTTNWTNTGLATMAQSSAESRWGAYSLHCLADTQFDRALYDADGFTAAATITVSCWIKVTCGANEVGIVVTSRPSGDAIGTAYHTGGGDWERLTVTGALTAAETTARLVARDDRAAGWTDYYVDGVQCEELGYVTTYCDGTQGGCEWNGTEHGSTSTRSALSRAGGRARDLTDVYNFYVTNFIDAGAAPLSQHLDEYAIVEGGEVAGTRQPACAVALHRGDG
jgi:hypothetical protein